MKPIQKLYSMNSMLSMEGMVDKTTRSLCEQIENRFVDGKNADRPCDIADWIKFCNCHYFLAPSSPASLWKSLTPVQTYRLVGCGRRVDV